MPTRSISFGEKIMMKILAISLLSLATPAQAVETEIRCPVRYLVEDLSLPVVPKGWDGGARIRARALLQGAGFAEVKEGQEVEMMGYGDTKTKQGYETKYVTEVGPKHFVCSYGGGIELFHRLPEKATLCVIKTKKRKTLQDDPDFRIVCK